MRFEGWKLHCSTTHLHSLWKIEEIYLNKSRIRRGSRVCLKTVWFWRKGPPPGSATENPVFSVWYEQKIIYSSFGLEVLTLQNIRIRKLPKVTKRKWIRQIHNCFPWKQFRCNQERCLKTINGNVFPPFREVSDRQYTLPFQHICRETSVTERGRTKALDPCCMHSVCRVRPSVGDTVGGTWGSGVACPCRNIRERVAQSFICREGTMSGSG